MPAGDLQAALRESDDGPMTKACQLMKTSLRESGDTCMAQSCFLGTPQPTLLGFDDGCRSQLET